MLSIWELHWRLCHKTPEYGEGKYKVCGCTNGTYAIIHLILKRENIKYLGALMANATKHLIMEMENIKYVGAPMAPMPLNT